MRLLRLAPALLLLLCLASVSIRWVWAEEESPPKGMTEADVRKLSGKLRSRASQWWSKRKKLAMKCPQCKGSGQVRWRRGRRAVMVACPKCDAFKIHVDKDHYRYCYYDMRSRDFRLQEGIKARLTKEYVKAKEGKPFPTIIKRYAIKEVEVVDETHGIVHVAQNKDSLARPQRWIWTRDAGKSPTWYLYDAEADGPWPSDEPPPEAPEPEETVPEPPAPRPRPVPEPTPQPEPAPRPPKPGSALHERADVEASLTLVKRWGEERNDVLARVLRIELGLEDVEGHEEKVTTSRTFLAEIKGWLDESKPTYERARKEVEEEGLGLRLDDRLRVNTFHFRAHRRLELVEKLLIAVLPDLKD